MKKTIIRVAMAIAGLGVAYFAFGTLHDVAAASKSKELCATIQVGMSEQQVTEVAVKYEGRYHIVGTGRGSASTLGWNMICRCSVNVKDAVVTHVSPSECLY